jgi:hypothetical protein
VRGERVSANITPGAPPKKCGLEMFPQPLEFAWRQGGYDSVTRATCILERRQFNGLPPARAVSGKHVKVAMDERHLCHPERGTTLSADIVQGVTCASAC